MYQGDGTGCLGTSAITLPQNKQCRFLFHVIARDRAFNCCSSSKLRVVSHTSAYAAGEEIQCSAPSTAWAFGVA